MTSEFAYYISEYLYNDIVQMWYHTLTFCVNAMLSCIYILHVKWGEYVCNDILDVYNIRIRIQYLRICIQLYSSNVVSLITIQWMYAMTEFVYSISGYICNDSVQMWYYTSSYGNAIMRIKWAEYVYI